MAVKTSFYSYSDYINYIFNEINACDNWTKRIENKYLIIVLLAEKTSNLVKLYFWFISLNTIHKKDIIISLQGIIYKKFPIHYEKKFIELVLPSVDTGCRQSWKSGKTWKNQGPL